MPLGYAKLTDDVATGPPLAGLYARMDRNPGGYGNRRRIAALRDALGIIEAAELVRREAIAAQRRALPERTASATWDDLVRARIAALRREAGTLAAFRAELPALRRQHHGRHAADDVLRREHARLSAQYTASRKRTAASDALRRLDALAFVGPGLDARSYDLGDPARADELLRAIAALVPTLPSTTARIAV